MSNIKISAFQNFHQVTINTQMTVAQLDKEISTTELSTLAPQIHELQQQINTMCEKVHGSKDQIDLCADQATRVDQCGSHLISKMKDAANKQVDELQKATESLQARFIEKVVISHLHDEADELLFQVTAERIKKDQDPEKLANLLKRWNASRTQLEQAMQFINQHKLTVSSDAKSTFDVLSLQLQSIKECLQTIYAFSREPIVQLSHLVMKGDPADRAQIDELILHMDPKFQARLDYFVYEFSPESKGGHEWGKHHRYDRVDIFQKAFGSAVWDQVRRRLPASVGLQRTDLKTALFSQFNKFANAQPDGNPRTVKLFAEKNIMLRPTELCQALWIKANSKIFQNIFYGNTKPFPYQKGYTVRASKEKSPLEKVNQKVETALAQKGIDQTIIRDHLRSCLESLPLEDKYAIETAVYFRSTDSTKGGDRWGAYHAYDDLTGLQQAIKERMAAASGS